MRTMKDYLTVQESYPLHVEEFAESTGFKIRKLKSKYAVFQGANRLSPMFKDKKDAEESLKNEYDFYEYVANYVKSE